MERPRAQIGRGRGGFSPHAASNALLDTIADDITKHTTSALFYSLAFLYQTPGAMQNAIKKVSKHDDIFVYGISDREVGGLDLQKPDGNVSPVFPSASRQERARALLQGAERRRWHPHAP